MVGEEADLITPDLGEPNSAGGFSAKFSNFKRLPFSLFCEWDSLSLLDAASAFFIFNFSSLGDGRLVSERDL